MFRNLFTFVFIFLFITVGAAPKAHSGLLDKINNTLGNLVLNNATTVKVPLNALNDKANENKWVRPSIGYSFQFMNYPEDPTKYLRRESLNLRLDIPKRLNGTVSILAGPSIASQFIRPFDKGGLVKVGKDFVSKEKPYSPTRAPHSPQKALELKPGDYYSFTTQMGFQIAASTAMLKGVGFLGFGFNYLVSGDFKVDVYRLEGSKVKVVASSLRQRSYGLNAKARLIPDIEVFGVSRADNLLSDQLQVEIMDWQIYKKTHGNLFSVSFVYDLSTDEGKEAYNDLANSTTWRKPILKIKNLKFNDPEAATREFWLANLSTSRKYADSNTGVVHKDESEMDYIQTSKGIRFDLKVAGTSNQRHFMEIDYKLRKTPQSPVDRYRIANLTIENDANFAFKLREYKTRREATVIFGLDEDSQIRSFDEITLSYKRTDSKLTLGKKLLGYDERLAIHGQLRKMLPESLHFWENELAKKLNPEAPESSFVSMEVNYSPEGLMALMVVTPKEINQVVDDFIARAVEKLRSDEWRDNWYYGDLELQDALTTHRVNGPTATYFSDQKLDPIKEGLAFILQPHTDNDLIRTQWGRFKKLRENIVFRDFGSAFLIRLLEVAALKTGQSIYDLIHFRLRYQSESKPDSHIDIGNFKRPDYTQALIRDRDRVLNRTYNPAHFIE